VSARQGRGFRACRSIDPSGRPSWRNEEPPSRDESLASQSRIELGVARRQACTAEFAERGVVIASFREEAKPLEHGAGLGTQGAQKSRAVREFHVEYVVYENMIVDFGDIARLAVATVALWPRRSVGQVAKIES
jgi:hypothetical protein